MEIKAEEISQVIRDQIKDYEKKVEVSETGSVLSVGDGIARVYGIEKAMAMEMVEFPGGITGLCLNLEEDNVGVAIMGDDAHVKEGDVVKRTGQIAQVPVGAAVLGRVIDAVGNPIDGKGPIDSKEFSRLEVVAPGVIARQSVDQPVQIGLKAVDSMVPIGRGEGLPVDIDQCNLITRVYKVRVFNLRIDLPDFGPQPGARQKLTADIPQRVASHHDVLVGVIGAYRHVLCYDNSSKK